MLGLHSEHHVSDQLLKRAASMSTQPAWITTPIGSSQLIWVLAHSLGPGLRDGEAVASSDSPPSDSQCLLFPMGPTALVPPGPLLENCQSPRELPVPLGKAVVVANSAPSKLTPTLWDRKMSRHSRAELVAFSLENASALQLKGLQRRALSTDSPC